MAFKVRRQLNTTVFFKFFEKSKLMLFVFVKLFTIRKITFKEHKRETVFPNFIYIQKLSFK